MNRLSRDAKRFRPERIAGGAWKAMLHVSSASDERLDAWATGKLGLAEVDPDLEHWIDELVTGIQRERSNVDWLLRECVGWHKAARILRQLYQTK